jgi:hypothetical protein
MGGLICSTGVKAMVKCARHTEIPLLKSSVTLLTDPCFLRKNQIPDRSAEPVIIPALPEDPSSRLFCPIRILSIYLDRTKNSRPAKNTRLFLPLKKGVSDISAKTISSWICRTILLAYESSGEEFLNRHSVKAHEVRALTSSWALFNSYAKDSDWTKQPRRRIFWQSWNNDWLSTPIWNLILSKETRIC